MTVIQVYSTQLASLAYEDSESEDDETDEVKTVKQNIFKNRTYIFKNCLRFFSYSVLAGFVRASFWEPLKMKEKIHSFSSANLDPNKAK